MKLIAKIKLYNKKNNYFFKRFILKKFGEHKNMKKYLNILKINCLSQRRIYT
jgi:hypothetical protein